MSKNQNDKYFSKFYSALSAKVIPAFHINDGELRTVYSLQGILNSEIIIEMIECYLLQGFNKLYLDLKDKLHSGDLSLNEAKNAIDNSSQTLITKLENYSCQYISKENHIPTIDDFEKYPSLFEEIGITNDDITKKIKKLDEKIKAFALDSTQKIELYMAKDPLDRKLFINKSISSNKVKELYNELTILGKEVVKCSLYDFEHFLRGKYSGGRIKFTTKSSIVTLVNCLKKEDWLDPNSVKYWKYVAKHVEDIKGNTWTSIAFDKKTKRYSAGEILDYQLNNYGEQPSIAITSSDIAINKFRKDGGSDWGVAGLSLLSKEVSVLSLHRIKSKQLAVKIMLHEFGHGQGLPHCMSKSPCFMNDARGKLATMSKQPKALCLL